MGFVVLITWFAAVLLGLFMLAVFSTGQLPAGRHAIAAESNFPAAVVALHGLFAVCTLLLTRLIALGVAAPE